MQTGQNSISAENSLPQLGQVRWGSALMVLIGVRNVIKPSKTARKLSRTFLLNA